MKGIIWAIVISGSISALFAWNMGYTDGHSKAITTCLSEMMESAISSTTDEVVNPFR